MFINVMWVCSFSFRYMMMNVGSIAVCIGQGKSTVDAGRGLHRLAQNVHPCCRAPIYSLR